MSPTDRSLRALRSIAAALVCVSAAGIGHVAAGGVLDPIAALGVFGGASAIVWLLSARRLTPGQLVGLLLLCQAVVHVATPTHDMTMGPSMLVVHLVATVVSAAVLARGERFVWSLAEQMVLRPLALLRAAAPTTAPRRVVVRRAAFLGGVVSDVAPARGPPVTALP